VITAWPLHAAAGAYDNVALDAEFSRAPAIVKRIIRTLQDYEMYVHNCCKNECTLCHLLGCITLEGHRQSRLVSGQSDCCLPVSFGRHVRSITVLCRDFGDLILDIRSPTTPAMLSDRCPVASSNIVQWPTKDFYAKFHMWRSGKECTAYKYSFIPILLIIFLTNSQ